MPTQKEIVARTALVKIIELLEPLPEDDRQRVFEATSVYFGYMRITDIRVKQ